MGWINITMSYGFTFLFKFCMFQVRINAFVENWQFFPLLLEHKYYSQFSIIEFICRGHLFVKGFSFEWRGASALIGGEGIKNMESFNLKGFYYSYTWSCSLYERKTSFCTGLISRKLCGFLRMFSSGFTSLSIFFLFPLSITFFVVIHGFWFYFI